MTGPAWAAGPRRPSLRDLLAERHEMGVRDLAYVQVLARLLREREEAGAEAVALVLPGGWTSPCSWSVRSSRSTVDSPRQTTSTGRARVAVAVAVAVAQR
jgi:hypothetical protein